LLRWFNNALFLNHIPNQQEIGCFENLFLVVLIQAFSFMPIKISFRMSNAATIVFSVPVPNNSAILLYSVLPISFSRMVMILFSKFKD